MFAIELTPENLDKIAADLEPSRVDLMSWDVYMKAKALYYVVRGYVDPRGALKEHAVLPEYIVRDNFEIDPANAKNNWDQIVRI